MRYIFWILAFFGSIAGGVILLEALATSNGAPQESAGAAIAIAFAVLPYVCARAFDALEHMPLIVEIRQPPVQAPKPKKAREDYSPAIGVVLLLLIVGVAAFFYYLRK